MAKATHRGSCQLCGAVHKINAQTGCIAKHGYNVKYESFVGTCPGSDALPYEKSRDALPAAIDITKTSISVTDEHLKFCIKEAKENLKVKFVASISEGYFKTKKVAVIGIVSVSDDGRTIKISYTVNGEARESSLSLFSLSSEAREFIPKDRKATVSDFARAYVYDYEDREIRARLRYLRSHLVYLQNRYDCWEPGNLVEVADEPSTGRQKRRRAGR